MGEMHALFIKYSEYEYCVSLGSKWQLRSSNGDLLYTCRRKFIFLGFHGKRKAVEENRKAVGENRKVVEESGKPLKKVEKPLRKIGKPLKKAESC